MAAKKMHPQVEGFLWTLAIAGTVFSLIGIAAYARPAPKPEASK